MMMLHPVKGAVLKKSATNTPDRFLIDKPIEIRWFQHAENNHLLVCLETEVKDSARWFIFAEHCTIVEEGVQVHPILIKERK